MLVYLFFPSNDTIQVSWLVEMCLEHINSSIITQSLYVREWDPVLNTVFISIHQQFSLIMFIIVTRLTVFAAETWYMFDNKHSLGYTNPKELMCNSNKF